MYPVGYVSMFQLLKGNLVPLVPPSCNHLKNCKPFKFKAIYCSLVFAYYRIYLFLKILAWRFFLLTLSSETIRNAQKLCSHVKYEPVLLLNFSIESTFIIHSILVDTNHLPVNLKLFMKQESIYVYPKILTANI